MSEYIDPGVAYKEIAGAIKEFAAALDLIGNAFNRYVDIYKMEIELEAKRDGLSWTEPD